MKVGLHKTHHQKLDGLWPKFEEVLYEPEKILDALPVIDRSRKYFVPISIALFTIHFVLCRKR